MEVKELAAILTLPLILNACSTAPKSILMGTVAKKESPEELVPFLTRPKIRSYIVPDTIEGNKFIKSHRIFILENPGEWSKD